MKKELYNNPETFLDRLRKRWNWHNAYYEALLEPAYEKLVKETLESSIKYHIACKANGDGFMDESRLDNIIVTKPQKIYKKIAKRC